MRCFERRAARLVSPDRVLQERPGALVLAARGREHPLCKVGRSAQRAGPDQLGERTKLDERGSGTIEVVDGDRREDEPLQDGDLARTGRPAAHPFEQLDSGLRVPGVEGESRPAELRALGRPRTFQQPRRFGRPPLPAAQLGKLDHRAGRVCRA